MCEHLNFEERVNIARIVDNDGVFHGGLRMDVAAYCVAREMPVAFPYLPYGAAPDVSTVSADGREARLPALIGDPDED